jgi:tetratricopeptide (TPR) repeat protein
MKIKVQLLLTCLLACLTSVPVARGQEQGEETPDYEQLIKDGRFLLKQKQFPEAAQCFTKYAQRYSSDPLSYFFLATLADESGAFQKAVPLYAKSLNLAKSRGLDSEELRINLGNTLLKLNYYDEAIFDFKRAIEINYKSQAAHLSLSKALLLKGNYSEALNELDRLNELGLEEPSLPLLRALALKNLGRGREGKKEAARYLESSDGKNPELKKIVLDLF